jgi:hypothetical protein
MGLVLIGLGLLATAYLGLCLFYAIFQERFIFIRFRTARRYKYKFQGHSRSSSSTPRTALNCTLFISRPKRREE